MTNIAQLQDQIQLPCHADAQLGGTINFSDFEQLRAQMKQVKIDLRKSIDAQLNLADATPLITSVTTAAITPALAEIMQRMTALAERVSAIEEELFLNWDPGKSLKGPESSKSDGKKKNKPAALDEANFSNHDC